MTLVRSWLTKGCKTGRTKRGTSWGSKNWREESLERKNLWKGESPEERNDWREKNITRRKPANRESPVKGKHAYKNTVYKESIFLKKVSLAKGRPGVRKGWRGESLALESLRMESLRKVIAGLRAKALKGWGPVMEKPADVKLSKIVWNRGKRRKIGEGQPGTGNPGWESLKRV
jgi:hypothetical protein